MRKSISTITHVSLLSALWFSYSYIYHNTFYLWGSGCRMATDPLTGARLARAHLHMCQQTSYGGNCGRNCSTASTTSLYHPHQALHLLVNCSSTSPLKDLLSLNKPLAHLPSSVICLPSTSKEWVISFFFFHNMPEISWFTPLILQNHDTLIHKKAVLL